jgi:hypothetical protein
MGVLADWTSGRDTYATLGVTHSLGRDTCALLYYARSNTDRAADFVGLNICLSCQWR